MKLSKSSKSGIQNVLFYPIRNKTPWLVRIVRNKRIVLHRYFSTKEEAILARDEFIHTFVLPQLEVKVNPAPGTDDM